MDSGDRIARIRTATEEIGEIGAREYMTKQIGATRLDVTPAGLGNRQLPQVYKKGDTYYVVEARGGKGGLETSRQVPGEVLRDGSPAYASVGSEQYLRLMLKDVAAAGGPHGALAVELEQALGTGRVMYLMIKTIPRNVPNAQSSLYQTIKRYRID